MNEPIKVVYRNHRGEFGLRLITPTEIRFGVSVFHGSDAQWLLECFDHDRLAYRTYALADCDFRHAQFQ